MNAEPDKNNNININKYENDGADVFSRDEFIIAVELDPPVNDDAAFFADGVKILRDAGADIITIADSPMGRPRMDSCMLAAKMKREYKTEVLPHMTCRDRNRNSVQAALLGLALENISNILLVTGDAPEDRERVKPVFQFKSIELAKAVLEMNQENIFHKPFRIFGALNINAKFFDKELEKARRKEQSGMSGFFTQPVLSQEAFENLRRAREILTGKLFGGVFPPISYRNAVYLNQNVHGIRVSDEIIALYDGKSREESEEIAVDLAVRTARKIEKIADGLYLMTPFRRVSMMSEIIRDIKNNK